MAGWEWFWRLDAVLFALSAGMVAVVWLGYPLLLTLWARWSPHGDPALQTEPLPAFLPRISVIISAHNEGAHIAARIRNLWEQGYAPDRLEVLVSEDGSSDDTCDQVRQLIANAPPRVRLRLLSAPDRQGKAAAVNRAVAAAAGDILVFTDANATFVPHGLAHLVAPFADPRVGAVSGRKMVTAEAGLGGGEGFYFGYEAWLTAQEMRTGGAVSGFGEALAVRRACFRDLPTKVMVNDDLWLVLAVMRQGRRVVSARGAQTMEMGAADEGAEWERRQRMAAGRWAALAQLWQGGRSERGWRRLSGRDRIKVLFHHVFRPLSALGLGVALVSGGVLLLAPAAAAAGWWLVPGLRELAWIQAGAYGLVMLAGLGRWAGVSLGRLEAPYFFVLALAAAAAGGWRYLRGTQSPLWQRVRRAQPDSSPDSAGGLPLVTVTANGSRSGQTPPPVNNREIVRNLFWASSTFFLGKVLVFASVAILARLLAPQAFGAVALATSTMLVLEIFGTLGLTSALIFEDGAIEAAANICFWITVATSGLEVALGWNLAPWIAGYFHEPQLTGMLRVLLASLVITALGNTHDTLLRRRLAFRKKMIPDLGMAAAKGIAGVILALLGWGAFSLIWGQVIGSVIGTLLLWRITGWRPSLNWQPAVARRMFAYAKHIYFLDASSVLLTNLDALTIGRMLNDAWLGFYTLAFRIPEVLLVSVLNVITRVVFPAFSRLQSDPRALRTTVLDTARYTAVLVLPMAVGMALLARPIVLVLYGTRWGLSIPVLQVLAVYAGIRCLTHHFGDAYKAIGRPDVLTRTTLAWWILLPPSLILGAHWGGIVGVASGQVVTRLAITLIHVYLIAHFLKIGPLQLWRCLAPAIEGTAVMSGGLLLLLPWTGQWAPLWELLAMVPLGMALYAAVLTWTHPAIAQDVWKQLRRARSPRRPREPAAGMPAAGVSAGVPATVETRP